MEGQGGTDARIKKEERGNGGTGETEREEREDRDSEGGETETQHSGCLRARSCGAQLSGMTEASKGNKSAD